mmetsp:Transcript_72932/g.200178  ORF Transcript_72932/g.200178 Transcript_72932/m.200178 type:complete len:254 (-) Transcript_72932:2821-3582(-)
MLFVTPHHIHACTRLTSWSGSGRRTHLTSGRAGSRQSEATHKPVHIPLNARAISTGVRRARALLSSTLSLECVCARWSPGEPLGTPGVQVCSLEHAATPESAQASRAVRSSPAIMLGMALTSKHRQPCAVAQSSHNPTCPRSGFTRARLLVLLRRRPPHVPPAHPDSHATQPRRTLLRHLRGGTTPVPGATAAQRRRIPNPIPLTAVGAYQGDASCSCGVPTDLTSATSRSSGAIAGVPAPTSSFPAAMTGEE